MNTNNFPANTIVQRLWNYCNVLRDDGMFVGHDRPHKMTSFDPHNRHRRSIRLPGYDYARPARISSPRWHTSACVCLATSAVAKWF